MKITTVNGEIQKVDIYQISDFEIKNHIRIKETLFIEDFRISCGICGRISINNICTEEYICNICNPEIGGVPTGIE